MKLKSLLVALCFTLIGHAFAANVHLNPNANPADKKSMTKETMSPGYCEIEIINDSFSDIYVSGTFDDYSSIGFNIYRFEAPHYVSLFYKDPYSPYAYCHNGMNITISSPFGILYDGWTYVNTTLRIVPYLNSAKAEIAKR